MMKIAVVDPGKVSGIALSRFDIGQVERPMLTELPPMFAVLAVRDFAPDLIVVEKFVPRPGAYTWQPDALEITGALKFVAWELGATVVEQTPAAAKRFATDAKLRTIGWYEPSKGGHKNDAARHLLLAAAQRGWVDLSALQG